MIVLPAAVCARQSGWGLLDLRGTFATKLYLANIPERDIAGMLGWTEERVQKIITRYVNREKTLRDIGGIEQWVRDCLPRWGNAKRVMGIVLRNFVWLSLMVMACQSPETAEAKPIHEEMFVPSRA